MENQAVQHPSRPDLLDRAKSASTSAGVYLMKDAEGHILYVGKAKNLKNRLTTYFQPAQHIIPRTEMMVGRVCEFDLILTQTEAEALILECTLIKKHRPKFNVRLKDDKNYPYLKIQLQDSYPRIEWTRKILKDGARYFGPFPSAWSARQVLSLLNDQFQLRDCSDNTFRHRSRPCILYQMDKCSGGCVGKITTQDYHSEMERVIAVLEGRDESLVQSLRSQMDEAAAEENYELAADLRDQVQHLEIVTATQGVDEAGSHRDRDVVGLSRKETLGEGVLLQIRGGRLVSIKHYHLQNMDASLTDSEILLDFLAQHYLAASQTETKGADLNSPPPQMPAQEILLPSVPDDQELLETTLGLKVTYAKTPIDEQLLSVARRNADYTVQQLSRRGLGTHGHGAKALEQVASKLGLSRPPVRIECFDNSNIQGEDAVASRVVFIDGAPDTSLYRRYKIRTVQGANDFATMKEVLSRRFSNSEEPLPDLVVVDGGKGQLAQAVAIFEELGIQGVGVAGLAKARTESDFKSQEVQSTFERVFMPGRKNPVNLLPHTDAYRLLVHVRDEAHRFAIAYHRLVRSKRYIDKKGKGGGGT